MDLLGVIRCLILGYCPSARSASGWTEPLFNLAQIKLRHVARLDLDWPTLVQPHAEGIPPDHPFAAEFNVVGARSLRCWLIILSALAAANVLLVIGHAMGSLPMLWAYSLFAYLTLYGSRFRQFKALFDEAHDIENKLGRLAPALSCLEDWNVHENAELAIRLRPVQEANRRPSRALRQIRRIAAASALTRSELLWVLFNFMVPWEMIFTYLLDRSKQDLQRTLPKWLTVWYEMEALCALAHYAELHVGARFPELTVNHGDRVFEAEGIGHPLIPEDDKIRNDFRIDGPGSIGLITGSNSPGKAPSCEPLVQTLFWHSPAVPWIQKGFVRVPLGFLEA